MELRGIQEAFLESDSEWKSNLSLDRRVRGRKSEEFPRRQTANCYQNDGGNKADFKLKRPVAVIGGFGVNPLVYYRENTSGVDLNELMHTDNIFDALGCDGALRWHLTDRQCRIRYLVCPQTLVFEANTKRDFTENKTAFANTDTRLCRNAFYYLFLKGGP